jgi:hypothetical protein
VKEPRRAVQALNGERLRVFIQARKFWVAAPVSTSQSLGMLLTYCSVNWIDSSTSESQDAAHNRGEAGTKQLEEFGW